MRFAFYGRVSTEDQQDPEASRNWQLSRARALTDRHGEVVAEFFDVGESRSIPWKRRPQATLLLNALRDPNRGFDAVAIGEPQRAFYGNQYGLTFPVFVHYGVQLWVPEVGGAVDPDSEAHDLVMSVFGGMSKGERNRIKIRVRSAMAAQASVEGRFLGGRPPYGYQLADAGPHPNPAKAADGKRLRRLVRDPVTAPVVWRIFSEYVAGRGIFAIAEALTRDDIPSPSAYDPARNPHRSGIAWSKGAIRTILSNPRYTGRQVWNRQRKEEVLIDVEDVALGHETKLRWNERDQWVWSEHLVHEALIDVELFERAQQVMAAKGAGRNTRERHRTVHRYVFRGLLHCGLCGRRMQGQQSRESLYYRCRFPNEYGLANKVEHPRNVYLAERELVEPLDQWLCTALAPHRLSEAINQMCDAQSDLEADPAAVAAARVIEESDQKLVRHRAALEAGADPQLVTGWMAEVQARRAEAMARSRTAGGRRRMSSEEIQGLVEALGSIRQVLTEADPTDKAEVYRQLGLRLTYQPGKRTVRAEATLDSHSWGYGTCPRGDLHTNHTSAAAQARE
ncbi:recombinase family protein [Amycolatopsis magusensis]|uniref:recombinase family protein n=1 Tax=Amycolatopsis magusensis TaxID=882444 RepID=UPI0024A8CF3D|nr:recombinase family protein [Amycolatopsis magusensis]MDI5979833.1 recombinase family protein [Amycolatopsis magusensis]